MSAKHGFAAAVLLVLIVGPLARAQMPLALPYVKESSPQATPANDKSTATYSQPLGPNSSLPSTGAPLSAYPPAMVGPNGGAPSTNLPQPTPSQQPNLSAYAPDSWIYQKEPNCCAPIGGHGPIDTDLYVRSGFNFVTSGGAFGKFVHTGWEVMGGGRSLFFVPEGDRAWAIDLGVGYTFNDLNHSHFVDFRGIQANLRHLDRTAVSVGFGHDWFTRGPGFVGGMWDANFRFGIDAGGRLGTAHIDLGQVGRPQVYLRAQDIYGGAFAGLHADMEVPMGAWTFIAGVRGEWAYDNMDLIPGINTNLQNINVLATVGVRY